MLLAVLQGVGSSERQTVRLVAFVGVRHDYDLPNAIAAQVAVDRVNEDESLLPNISLELDVLDSTIVRTMSPNYEMISDSNMDAIKLDLFSTLFRNSLHQLCVHESGGGNGGLDEGSAACQRNSGVAGLIGPLYSSEIVILKTLLQRYSVLAMSYGATSPTLSDPVEYGNVGRTIPSDFFQGEAIAGLVTYVKVPAVQVWSCSDVYCEGLAAVFRSSLPPTVGLHTHLTQGVEGLDSEKFVKQLLEQGKS